MTLDLEVPLGRDLRPRNQALLIQRLPDLDGSQAGGCGFDPQLSTSINPAEPLPGISQNC
jgi:hypothetical protein